MKSTRRAKCREKIYEKKIKLSQTDINKSHINMRRNFLSRFPFDSLISSLDAINFPSITIFREERDKNWRRRRIGRKSKSGTI
jgi:hypothetical protein